eukprot:gene28270-35106_t
MELKEMLVMVDRPHLQLFTLWVKCMGSGPRPTWSPTRSYAASLPGQMLSVTVSPSVRSFKIALTFLYSHLPDGASDGFSDVIVPRADNGTNYVVFGRNMSLSERERGVSLSSDLQ